MFVYLAMAYTVQRFWPYHCDCCHALTQTYNFGAETHLGDRVMSAFVFPSDTITIGQALASILIGSTALRNGPLDYTAMNSVMHWRLGPSLVEKVRVL